MLLHTLIPKYSDFITPNIHILAPRRLVSSRK